MTASSPTAAESHATTGASLKDLLRAGATSKEIASHLDALAPATRLAQVVAVQGKGVKRLYEAVKDAAPVVIDELIPPSSVGTTVILQGRNSLPLFTSFQKRFYRLESGVIVGYNHQTMSFVTGPGYFLFKPANGEGEHGEHKTEPYFDYTEDAPMEPPGWPAFKSNTSGLSKLVYGNMKDYVRRVARGVIVGKAYKLGKSQDAYFTLTLPG